MVALAIQMLPDVIQGRHLALYSVVLGVSQLDRDVTMI
jgi:hypothetical protein